MTTLTADKPFFYSCIYVCIIAQCAFPVGMALSADLIGNKKFVSVCVCAVQDIVFQLQRFVSGMSHYYDECYAVLKEADVFPIEVDLSRTTLNCTGPSYEDEDEEGEDEHEEEKSEQTENGAEKLIDDE